MVVIFFILAEIVIFTYKVSLYTKQQVESDNSIKNEGDIFEIILQDYKTERFTVDLVLLIVSIYILIFVDSLHKSVREFRHRYYVVAKL